MVKVNYTGYLEISTLIEAYTKYLQVLNCFSNEGFNYNEIEFLEDGIQYKNTKSQVYNFFFFLVYMLIHF